MKKKVIKIAQEKKFNTDFQRTSLCYFNFPLHLFISKVYEVLFKL